MDSLEFDIFNSTLFKDKKDTVKVVPQDFDFDFFDFDFDANKIPFTPIKIEKNPQEPRKIINPHKFNPIKKEKQKELEKMRKVLHKLQKIFFELESEVDKL
jgi:hypothetical protein